MDQAQKNYQKLHDISKRTRTLQGIEALLHWDQETYMPKDASNTRAEQLQILAGIIHKQKTSQSFSSALNKLINIKTGKISQKGLTLPQQAALKEWKRSYVRDTALPAPFVEEFAKVCSESIYIWANAKKNNDFKQFLPNLEKIITLNRKKADYLGFKDHPYDPLIDEYEPHMTMKEVKSLFTPLKKSTVDLLSKIQSAKQVDNSFLVGGYTLSKQKTFNEILLKVINYPTSKGRLDLSTHPFSSASHPTDSRITTRIDPKHPMSNIRSVLHEAGHGFYEIGLPQEQYGTPLGDSISLGVHESQSRWWETLIGLSKPFWKYSLPLLKKHFKGKLENVTLDQFWKGINKVEPSMIRVEADEVTYALHVILRFELEVQLIEGSLKPKEIPEAWNAKMQELLGIKPKNDSEGCLQDIHWSMGAFGYFPTYSLGNLYASHLFQAFSAKYPSWEKSVEKGELSFIREWLEDHVHKYGKRYTSKELLKKVTGKTFSSKAFETYLQNKYSKVYMVS